MKVFKTWIPKFSETRAFGDMVILLKGNQLVVRALPTVLTVRLKITYKSSLNCYYLYITGKQMGKLFVLDFYRAKKFCHHFQLMLFID